MDLGESEGMHVRVDLDFFGNQILFLELRVNLEDRVVLLIGYFVNLPWHRQGLAFVGFIALESIKHPLGKK